MRRNGENTAHTLFLDATVLVLFSKASLSTMQMPSNESCDDPLSNQIINRQQTVVLFSFCLAYDAILSTTLFLKKKKNYTRPQLLQPDKTVTKTRFLQSILLAKETAVKAWFLFRVRFSFEWFIRTDKLIMKSNSTFIGAVQTKQEVRHPSPLASIQVQDKTKSGHTCLLFQLLIYSSTEQVLGWLAIGKLRLDFVFFQLQEDIPSAKTLPRPQATQVEAGAALNERIPNF